MFGIEIKLSSQPWSAWLKPHYIEENARVTHDFTPDKTHSEGPATNDNAELVLRCPLR